MMMTDPKDSFVDDLFAQARNEAVTPSDDLMARVLSDASAAMPTAFSVQPNAADILGTTTQITLMPDFDEFDFSETLDG